MSGFTPGLIFLSRVNFNIGTISIYTMYIDIPSMLKLTIPRFKLRGVKAVIVKMLILLFKLNHG